MNNTPPPQTEVALTVRQPVSSNFISREYDLISNFELD